MYNKWSGTTFLQSRYLEEETISGVWWSNEMMSTKFSALKIPTLLMQNFFKLGSKVRFVRQAINLDKNTFFNISKSSINPSWRSANYLVLKRSFQLPLVILILLLLINMGSWYTCPATVASTNALTSNQFSFSGISSTLALGVTTSSTSSNLYFLYQVFSPGPYAVIRKVNSADTVAWMAAVVFWPIIKSVVVSANEQYVFFGSASTPLNVIRLSATSGVIIDQQQ